eukprot:TRINITY_DN27172_c0_g1_i1.p1 TRINITY_DN27172_c0_g1~~TRINITY_DN27172_c0_g1_i1.p1  ORF type:complete len:264 (-),score=51.16 TRINITY_DN27172_c0_g1_i1:43-834(-)
MEPSTGYLTPRQRSEGATDVDFDSPAPSPTKFSGQRGARSPYICSDEPPRWDDATGLFWCRSRVNAYDVPDGREWMQAFKELVEKCKPEHADKPRRMLARHSSDAPTPGAASQGSRPGRRLARFPSDPDKRIARAVHTSALTKMPYKAGIEARVQGRLLAFFRLEGRIFAVDGFCPHLGANLCGGEIGDIEDMVDGRRHYITCPVHKMQFDLASGDVIDGDCPKLQTYPVRILDVDDVHHIAMIEVGFASLTDEYFHGVDMDD